VGGTAHEAARGPAFIRAEIDSWGNVVKAAAIKVV